MPALGRLPAFLMTNAREVEISAVHADFQGNEAGIFHIYTGDGEELIRNGFLDEAAALASLDVNRASAATRSVHGATTGQTGVKAGRST